MTGTPVTGTPVTRARESAGPPAEPPPTLPESADADLEQHTGDGGQEFESEPRDWAWVEEWREGGEPMPWGPGLAVATFTALLVASAVYVLSSGLSNKPLLAIGVNIVVVAGLCPALWLSRGLPVLRWIAGGAAAGVLAAWLCVLIFLI